MCDMALREERAFENMTTAIEMHEMYERVSINNHKSFLPHLAIYKASADILLVSDVWAADLSPLELLNAETKRIAERGGSKHLELKTSGLTVAGPKSGREGPAKLIQTKGYSTTMALSTLNNLLVTQHLHRGDGPVALPDSRRSERLFGDQGRTKAKSSGFKLQLLGRDYDPQLDSCIKTFVRLMANVAATSADMADAAAPAAPVAE